VIATVAQDQGFLAMQAGFHHRDVGDLGCRAFDGMYQAVENTTKLAVFVLFILIGSTVFSFTFNAADGHIWVEHLFDGIPGGQMGFLLVVNALV
jgi:TRAP-type mannitol/chloroaromatic compound transport system permease large subunit